LSPIEIDTTIGANANVASNFYTLWVGATNPAAVVYKPIIVTIVVCDGSETLALANPQDQTYSLEVGQADIVVEYPDTWWTTTDASC